MKVLTIDNIVTCYRSRSDTAIDRASIYTRTTGPSLDERVTELEGLFNDCLFYHWNLS